VNLSSIVVKTAILSFRAMGLSDGEANLALARSMALDRT
jgi:hypothetical protein